MKPTGAHNPAGRKFFLPRDIIIITAVLLAALVLWLIFFRGAQAGEVAVVTIGYGNVQETRKIPLGEDRLVEIEAELPVHLQVKDGAIRFVDSVCPDHDCERMGLLRHEGDWAACLPAGVSVRVEETAG